MYHGANRLGGNSLLAAVYSGGVAADALAGRTAPAARPDFSETLAREREKLARNRDSQSAFPVMYIRDMLAESMQRNLGIVRDDARLSAGLEDVEYDLSVADRIRYDNSVMPYFNYSLTGILTTARATLACAKARKESRGAHFRSDHPQMEEAYHASTIISYDDGNYTVRLDQEQAYES